MLRSDIGLDDLGLADSWVPFDDRTASAASRDDRRYSAVARLSPGVSTEEVQAELNILSEALAQEYPTTNRGWGATVLTAQDAVVGPEARILLTLLVTLAALVLVVASLNVGGLMMARLGARRREIAVRSAIGAGHWRLMRQFAVESLMVASLAALAGAFLAAEGFRVVTLASETTNPFFQQMRLYREDVIATATVAALASILFTLLPVWRSTRRDRGNVLKLSRDMSTSTRQASRSRRTLVAAELGVAVLLVIFAGLWVQAATALRELPNGFVAEHLLTMRLDHPDAGDTRTETPQLFFEEALRAVRTLPGVLDVGVGSFTPVLDREPTRRVQIEGRTENEVDRPWAVPAAVGARYLDTLRVPVVDGRSLNDQDVRDSRAVVLVNETMAEQHWPSGSPIDARIRFGDDNGSPWLTVVGVTGNVRNSDLDQPSLPYVYLPYTLVSAESMSVFVRTEGDPTQMSSAVRRAIWSVDGDQPAYAVRSMEQVLINDNVAGLILIRVLVGLALLAVALATSGVYAVLSYSVGRRTAEIGIRMALGASRYRVVRLIVQDGLAYSVVGLVLGMLGAWGMARLSASQLYGVTAADPMTFTTSALGILGVVVLAGWLPARAAARLSPLIAIRRD